jgi:hypothetical protein
MFFRRKRKMKKLILFLAFLGICTLVQAGVEFIGVDGVQTDFNARTGVLSLDSSNLVVTVDYDDGSPQSSISPASFTMSSSYVSGMQFAGGTFSFVDDGAASGIISGNVLTLDFAAAGGFLVGSGKAEVTSSNLAGYPLGESDIVSLTFALLPAFTSFDQDYTGLSKINFLVPEPMTMVLMGAGALLLRKRKKA